MTKLLRYLPVILLIACSQARNMSDSEENSNEIIELPPIEVEIDIAEKKRFFEEIVSNGKLRGHNRAVMRFQVAERIQHIFVYNGQLVKRGDLLAELDNFELKSKLDLNKINFSNAKISLEDYLIGQGYNLTDSTSIPKEVLQLSRIKSGYARAKKELEIAEYNLSLTRLTASATGVVANLSAKENTYPSPQEPFCLIIDNLNFEIEFPIMESEASLVSIGQGARVVPYYDNENEVGGKIIAINPLIDESGLIKVTALIKNKNRRLLEGMNAKVFIKKDVGRKLIVPKTAVTLRSEKPVVFVYSNGLAKWTYVQTEEENSEHFVIKEGLVEGDSIIVKGNLHLAHESKIILVD